MTSSLPAVLGGPALGRLKAPPWPSASGGELERIANVLRSGLWAFDGPLEHEFERAFADFQSAEYGLCVANGTVALQLALEALDIGVGDEVIVPGFTWQATVAAVIDVNAIPILVDVEPDSYCIDADLVAAAVTERTRAIIAVHLYDGVADIDRLLDIAARHGIALIEDCAHSHGSRWKDRGVGSLGDFGTFSFQSTKSLTAGEGGFVSTNNSALRERIYSLRNCGRRRTGSLDAEWRPIQSGNYRMTEWQSAVLLSQLERLPEQLERRAAAMEFLDEQLLQIPGIRTTRRRPEVTRQGLYAYVIRFDSSPFGGLSGKSFREALSAELGIDIRSPYEPLNNSPLLLPQTKRRHHISEEYWRKIDLSRFELPVAEHAHATEASVLPHEYLLLPPSELQVLPEAIARLYSEKTRLVDWERSRAA